MLLISIPAFAKYETILKQFPAQARQYNADSRYLIIVDYKIPSNKNRMFIWDVYKNKAIYSCWCAHGFGKGSTAYKPVFSNTPGSNCSSLGWFLLDKSIGVSTHYGYKYHAVDGLSSTNSNARRRQILLHPWFQVTNDCNARIKYPMPCDYRSAGCFTTTLEGFNTISNFIKNRNKRILLYSSY